VEESLTVTGMTPMAGATNVDVGTTVSLVFSHPMAPGMESHVVLHEGDLTGPAVAGTWMWTLGQQRLEFHPDAPLRHQFRYTFHMGGGVQDAAGRHLSYEHCINMHGAEWVWEQMMGGHHPGMGWRHQNGSYGVSFWFETM
jgi:hypothetical protein